MRNGEREVPKNDETPVSESMTIMFIYKYTYVSTF